MDFEKELKKLKKDPPLPDLKKNLSKSIDKAFEVAFDPSYWVLTNLGISLYENQIDIFENVIDLSKKYVSIIAARASGKTFSVATGLVKLCIDHPKLVIGVFAPKAGQALRINEEIYYRILTDETREKFLDIKRTTKGTIVFLNGATIHAQSAAEESNIEGFHADLIVLEESQNISSFAVSQKLLPMIGGSKHAKVIQLGVSLYKGHFYQSFQNKQYSKIIYPWHKCDKLLESGSIIIDGKAYPKLIVDQMPYVVKQNYFPKNPDMWYDSISNMSVEDWKTQYEMEWLDDINRFLSEDDIMKLASGTHQALEVQNPGEHYYFGLDFAGGILVGEKIESDFTALCVWRKDFRGFKEKVYAMEWKGDLSKQLEEIMYLINPLNGIFKCEYGLADYGNMGAGIIDQMKKEGLKMDGVFFGARDPDSQKNYKNSMCDHFLFELQSNRIKYPYLVNPLNKRPDFSHPSFTIIKKHFDQWCVLETRKGFGVNAKIAAPEGEGVHDDGCMADVMACFAIDKMKSFGQKQTISFPKAPTVKSMYKSPSMINNFPSMFKHPRGERFK